MGSGVMMLLAAAVEVVAQAQGAAGQAALTDSVAQGRSAEMIRELPAPEAHQGVAIGPDGVYAVTNSAIARYDRRTGARLAIWQGDKARFPHVNSCTIVQSELVCAASNYPAVPHASSVEFFDPQTLTHKRSVSLGLGTGSLTWVDWHDGAWWAIFANYDGRGGEPPRDHRHTVLVRFDAEWRRGESWAMPQTILQRIAPMSISGAGFRAGGDLWLSGHDLPELYVVCLPKGGAALDHIATVPMQGEGQAIDWDDSQAGILWGISRKRRVLIEMRVPEWDAAAGAPARPAAKQ